VRHVFFLFIYSIVSINVSPAQDKCGTVAYNEIIKKSLHSEPKNHFENWMRDKLLKTRAQRFQQSKAGTSQVYSIPMVVHVIHNGEAIGSGTNIPDAQIFSQMVTMNEDFRRLNADTVDTPPAFLSVAADIEVEFILAKRDPEGLPTSGITRTEGPQSTYSMNNDSQLKAISYWSVDDYLNVWVAPLSGGLLGYAQFPVSNLEGMDTERSTNELTDGIVVDWEYFGTGFNADDFSKGRTATHEIGHWLGLRHVWGDGGCAVDDFCTDTPQKDGSTLGCPSPESEASCGSVDMFQNYLDFTDDVCMNLFTTCQSARMRTVVENSPRRLSLLSSKGGIDPIQVANDLGIRSILSPQSGNCESTLTPQVEVRNYGTNNINAFEIEFLIDGALIEIKNISQSLDPLALFTVAFSPISTNPGMEMITYEIKMVNGSTDGNGENNCRWITANFPTRESVPFFDDFENSVDNPSVTDQWIRSNSNNLTSAWEFAFAPEILLDNDAAVLKFHDSPSQYFGTLDYLISPVFDLSGYVTLDLSFKYAYANRPGNNSDAFMVMVSTDCGVTFPENQVLFQEYSANLATTNETDEAFVPEGPGDWLDINSDLGEFIGEQNVVFAFVGQNGGGNDLYLDDIAITSNNTLNNDLAIVEVTFVPLASCVDNLSPLVTVKNVGANTVADYVISYSYSGGSGSVSLTNTILQPGKNSIRNVLIQNIEEGNHTILFSVDQPNGQEDPEKSNNALTKNFVLDNYEEFIPLREEFNSSFQNSDWIFAREDSLHNWDIIDTPSSNNSVWLNGYENTVLGIQNWLISPLLDFSATDSASVLFRVSYANRSGRNDRLKVFASSSCGQFFEDILYDQKGAALAITQSETAWIPQSAEDWKREYISLTKYAGRSKVRLAFAVTNQNGNNLYLDDIEFYTADNPNPVEIEQTVLIYPNPASDHFSIVFNFNIKEEVLIRLTDLNGSVMTEAVFDNTLNQIYQVNNLVLQNGIYLLYITGNNTDLAKKVIIQN